MFCYRHQLGDCCSVNLLCMIMPSAIQNSSLNTNAVNRLLSFSYIHKLCPVQNFITFSDATKLDTVISRVLKWHLSKYVVLWRLEWISTKIRFDLWQIWWFTVELCLLAAPFCIIIIIIIIYWIRTVCSTQKQTMNT